MMVFFIEADESNLACLQGNTSLCDNTSGTQGDWITGTPYPMFLTCAAPSGNGNTVNSNYNIAYFPTVYTVCPDRTIYESGQLTTAQHYTFANSHCAPLTTTVNDVKAFSCTVPNIIYCNGSFTPSFMLQNYGTANLTSCNITVKLDGNIVQQVPWTGNLAMYDAATLTLNQISGLTNGNHTLEVITDNPNGLTDEGIANNSVSKTVTVMTVPDAIPITEDFSGSVFPPAQCDIIDVSNDGYNWVHSSTAGHTAGSMYIEFYSIMSGKKDDFEMPLLDFTGMSNPTLTFWVAHRRYSASYTDKLEVDVSTDCGTTWTQKWMKSGATLATNASYYTSEYLNPAAGDWRQETVDLSAYQNTSNIMIRFRATSGYGNNAFVDDINVSNVSSFNNTSLSKNVSIYPNPAQDKLFITLPEKATIQLVDLMGKVIYTTQVENNNDIVSTSSFANGTYFVRVITDNETITQKIVINH